MAKVSEPKGGAEEVLKAMEEKPAVGSSEAEKAGQPTKAPGFSGEESPGAPASGLEPESPGMPGIEGDGGQEGNSPDVSVWETDTPPSSSKKLIVVLLVILILVGLVIGGILYLRSRKGTDGGPMLEIPGLTRPSAEVTPSPAEDGGVAVTPPPTATPSGELQLADYSVQVLNGSGVPGEAGTVKGLLEAAGFANIETGNADSYDYKDTEVRLRQGTPKEVFDTIAEILDDYTVVSGKALTQTSEYEVIVIIGVKKEAAAPG